ncbi:MAG: biotin/lipoyl-containing protein, partial [Myxococcota bacterium]
ASGRHIEVQIFGDAFGDVVHLFERECSIQRRHQKIIEESPAPNLSTEVRDGLHEAAVAAGHALGYRGAGTVEFILAPNGDFYFLEVNTRLQVEHPVTEMVLGMDLVRLQLLMAEGRPLPEEVRFPVVRGHAIEARLYAEDSLNGYSPMPGRVHRFEVGVADGIRVDSGIEAGSEVTVDYDPMLAKVIAHGPTRDEASRRLRLALRSARIHGVGTNRELLVAILGHAAFGDARVDTGFLDDTPPAELLAAASEDENHLRLQLLAAALAAQASRRKETPVLRAVPSGWRNNPSMLQREILVVGDVTYTVEYSLGRSPAFRVDGEPVEAIVLSTSTDSVTLVHEGVRRSFVVELVDGMVFVDGPTGSLGAVVAPRFEMVEDDGPAGSLTAPMPGTVVKVLVAIGDVVGEGDLILVMEAMKMEHSICAPADGVVSELMASVGDSVGFGALLAVVDAEEGDADDVG